MGRIAGIRIKNYGSLKDIYKQVESHNFLLNTCIQTPRNKGLGVILKD